MSRCHFFSPQRADTANGPVNEMSTKVETGSEVGTISQK